MQISRRNAFTTVKTAGGLLPADLLLRITEGDPAVGGLTPEAYHLAKSERLNEAANRAWNRLQGAWEGFKAGMEKLPEADAGTSLTRERWLLILFQELGYGRLQTAKAFEIGGKTYPVSHMWQATPIHLVSFRQELDRRTPGARGAARVSPHSVVQELLNRSESFLWGFISNGLCLRILRDNASLTRAACVEFDLQAMMDGEAYSDFFLLYLLCHQSRVEVPEGKTPEHSWLEKWYNTSLQEGTRVLDRLRDGVEQAIEALGGGFLAHPANTALRENLRAGRLSTQDYYRQVLRTVYRLLFLFVAEDRDLLLLPAGSDERLAAARGIYTRYYSTQRLRRLAERRRSARHSDLYRALRLVFAKLHTGCLELALPALGSFLFSPDATPHLGDADIANADLLAAVWNLTFTVDGNVRRSVDYRNLGPEELGSVYESLLEMHPEINLQAGRFKLIVAAGSERKTTGSYYTPTPLVNCLLDSALDPVLDEACKAKDPEKALLDLKICDPACGSGHFLIAAAHRVAKRLASIRAGEDEPAPESIQHAVRDVVGRCIYGVDINLMAVELCKINLWMEAIEPGRPLSFLDHHIQWGNSLLGSTPALIAQGIPGDAFKPIEGDVKEVCSALKRENKDERRGQRTLWAGSAPFIQLGNLAQTFADLDAQDDSDLQAVGRKERRYYELVKSAAYENARFLADAWCAAFVWPKTSHTEPAVTTEVIRRIAETPHYYPDGHPIREGTRRLRDQYNFFHWHLAFPDVFRLPGKDQKPEDPDMGWSGGFDVVLGNPPWERIKLQEKEFFAARDPEIASAPNAAARKGLIVGLRKRNPDLCKEFEDALRKADGESALVRDSGRFPLCGRGDVNTYSIFAELKRGLLNPCGRVGCIVPSGIATDDTTKFFFQDLMESSSLASLYSFENEEFIFPSIHHATKFCLLTMTGSSRPQEKADFVFFARQTSYLAEEERHFSLSPNEMALLNPNTRTCAIFRSKRDAELSKIIHRRVPVLIRESPPATNSWEIDFLRMFDMANSSALFQARDQLESMQPALDGNTFRRGDLVYLPLYEAKMIHQFDHRFGTYEGQTQAQANQGKLPEADESEHADSRFHVVPGYWVEQTHVDRRLEKRDSDGHITWVWDHEWIMGWRDITSAVTVRTLIAAVVPRVACGDTFLLLFPSGVPAGQVAALLACLNSLPCDYACRQKIGGNHLKYHVFKQVPVLPPQALRQPTFGSVQVPLESWLLPRALELTYTAWELEGLGGDCGYSGPPFVWDAERRFLIRCELDAAFFHVYLGTPDEWQEKGTPELLEYFPTPRHAVAHIMDTFSLVKERDEAAHGRYRTKDTILEIYDEMAAVSAANAAAVAAGRRPTAAYQTRLNPPPGPPTDAAGSFIPTREWTPAIWARYKNVIHPPREAARPAAATVGRGRVIGYVTLLLRTWDKPVTRQALEPALVLMLNDGIRKTLLGKKPAPGPKTASRAMPQFVRGLDQLLAAMKDTGALGPPQKAKDGSQVLSVGPGAVALNGFPAADRDRAGEAVQALEVLSLDTIGLTLEESADAYCEVV